ncbi:hypothetical protein SAMN05518849_12831 [Sphingobium sp. AP50]|uniref:hypothetical protein n=1 Tax=Sphingobium sp. AP50 TaxID=1884369 RepID=UPI0008B7FA51|nr:hypothetical protein [Sphingobium sp. AP50]SEK02187.1 hypothetical protein SAMN05518849_12831 [Sphingobium sp. AP50]
MAQFQILHPLSQDDWRPVTAEFVFAPHADQQYIWPSFAEAEAARQSILRRMPTIALRVALAGTDPGDIDWQTREQLRFADATYTPTPWHEEPWYRARHEEHFCHISTKQAGKIAFTENAAKGALDRQLIMSPGRYLHRYFSEHLDNEAIEGWCARLSVQLQENTLTITQDADEIEEVYVGGPTSCMAHRADHFSSPCHPVRAYAGPDTALAYIGPRDDAKARCIIWPERSIYTSVYGDVSRLTLLLEEAGFVSGSLNGARIQRIPHGDHFVVPYIDHGDNLEDDGEHLIIGHGRISSGATTGLADVPWYCENCDNEAEPCETVQFPDGDEQEWCSDCFHNQTTYCDHNQRHYSDSEDFITVHANHGSSTILADDSDEFGAVYLSDRDEWWDRDCCRRCDASDEWYHADDLTEYHGEWLCDEELPEPFDDDDAAMRNAHIVTRLSFHADMAAIHSLVAKWEAAGEQARAVRLRRQREEAEHARFRLASSASALSHQSAALPGDAPQASAVPEIILSVTAMALPSVASSHAGA